tara:strand:+ start:2573 stop:2911 length:339 start_codon:yes stop_codon:yes gene_type:complete
MKHLFLFAAFWAALLSCVKAQTPMYQAEFKHDLLHVNVLIAPAEASAAMYDYSCDSVTTYTMQFVQTVDFQLVNNNTGAVVYFEHQTGDTYTLHTQVLNTQVTATGTFSYPK